MSKQLSIWKTILAKTNKKHILIVLLAGVLLLVISMPTTTNLTKQDENILNTELEQRLESILEKTTGVGNVSVMITSKDKDKIEGVAVVAEGADNAVVVQTVTEIVQALFPVDSHKIKVIKAK